MLRMQTDRLVCLAILLFGLSLGASLSAPPLSSTAGTAPSLPAEPAIEEIESQMMTLINIERQKAGLPALVHDPSLASVARAHSREMAAHGVIAHALPASGSAGERLDRVAYGHRTVRENVGRAYAMEAAHNGFVKSPKHLANQLSMDVTHAGVGIVIDNRTPSQDFYITQIFAHPAASREPAELRDAFLAAVEEARQAEALNPILLDPLLENLAYSHLTGMAGLPNPETMKTVLDEAVRQARSQGLRDVAGIALDVQLLRDEADLRVPSHLRQARAKSLGTAALKVHDSRNRPRIMLLSFVGLGS